MKRWFSSQCFHPLEIKVERMNTLIVEVHFDFKWDVTTGYKEKHLVMVIQLCKIAVFHPVNSDTRLPQSFNYKIFSEGRRGQETRCPAESPCPWEVQLWAASASTAKLCVAKSQPQAVCPGLSMAVICFISKGYCCLSSRAHVWVPCRMRAFLADPDQIGGVSRQGQDPSHGQDPSQVQCCQPAASRSSPATHMCNKTGM